MLKILENLKKIIIIQDSLLTGKTIENNANDEKRLKYKSFFKCPSLIHVGKKPEHIRRKEEFLV